MANMDTNGAEESVVVTEVSFHISGVEMHARGVLGVRQGVLLIEVSPDSSRGFQFHIGHVQCMCVFVGVLQVPQFILEDAVERGCGAQCQIICTQPRRISAISGTTSTMHCT